MGIGEEAAGPAERTQEVVGNEVGKVSRAQMVQSFPGHRRAVGLVLRPVNNHWILNKGMTQPDSHFKKIHSGFSASRDGSRENCWEPR